MVDYRKKSLRFLYDVMRGAVDDIYVRAYKDQDLIVENVPASLEVRQKAAERILKYYTDQDNTSKPGDTGIIILPQVEFKEGINQSNALDC